MTDPTRLEPRNGDFVAYVEALQEESLEALRRANQAAIANPLQVPDASEGGADLGRIAAEMQRRARAERGDEATHDVLRRTKKSVAESFRPGTRRRARSSGAQTGRAARLHRLRLHHDRLLHDLRCHGGGTRESRRPLHLSDDRGRAHRPHREIPQVAQRPAFLASALQRS